MSREGAKELYRVKTKDSEGEECCLLILSDPDQFIVAWEKVTAEGKNAGEIRLGEPRYYPSIEGAIKAAVMRLSKAEAKDLRHLAELIGKHFHEFEIALGIGGVKDF